MGRGGDGAEKGSASEDVCLICLLGTSASSLGAVRVRLEDARFEDLNSV
jgi:hypothetical protein